MKPKNSGLIDSLNRVLSERKKKDNDIEVVVFDKEYFEDVIMTQVEPGSYWHIQYNQVLQSTAIYDDSDLDPVIVYDKKKGVLYASSMQAVNGELN